MYENIRIAPKPAWLVPFSVDVAEDVCQIGPETIFQVNHHETKIILLGLKIMKNFIAHFLKSNKSGDRELLR